MPPYGSIRALLRLPSSQSVYDHFQCTLRKECGFQNSAYIGLFWTVKATFHGLKTYLHILSDIFGQNIEIKVVSVLFC